MTEQTNNPTIINIEPFALGMDPEEIRKPKNTFTFGIDPFIFGVDYSIVNPPKKEDE